MRKRRAKIKPQYISLAKAEKVLGCSRGYLTYLCRNGKLRAIKIGVEWMTTEKWIEEYKNKKRIRKNPALVAFGKQPASNWSLSPGY